MVFILKFPPTNGGRWKNWHFSWVNKTNEWWHRYARKSDWFCDVCSICSLIACWCQKLVPFQYERERSERLPFLCLLCFTLLCFVLCECVIDALFPSIRHISLFRFLYQFDYLFLVHNGENQHNSLDSFLLYIVGVVCGALWQFVLLCSATNRF